MTYPVPDNEHERLAALRELRILGTAPDPIIDRICNLARDILDVPVALMSLVDEHEQWFKSRCGLDIDHTSREVAFCNYTLLTDQPFVVADASADSRFVNNPLVTGDLHVRAYAGVPLALAPGLNLGTLCCIDVKPRAFSVQQVRMLEELGAIIIGQLRLHQANNSLADQAHALREREAILARTEELAKVGGFEVELSTKAVSWSDNMYRLYDMAPGEGTSLITALEAYSPEGRAAIERTLGDGLPGARYEGEFAFTSAHGTKRWVRTRGQIGDIQGDVPLKLTGIVQDVSDRKAAEERLRWAADHDALTGLPNRKLLHEELERALSAYPASGSCTGLVYIDVDGFKEVNDKHGHAAGDAVLRAIADRLRAAVDSSHVIARMGGDEFAVIVRGVRSASEIEDLARSVIQVLREPVEHDGFRLGCHASIGISLFPGLAGDTVTLLSQADMALYAAKRTGRDRFALFDPTMRVRMEQKSEMLARATEALAAGTIFPFYQPKVALGTGRIVGFEALLRIVSDGAVHSPASIQDAFDDPALSVRLGERMLERILSDMRGWQEHGDPFGSVALNVAAAEFSPSFARTVIDKVTDAGLRPECLEIEVTETVFLGDGSEQVGSSLAEFHSKGVKVALDDFGTGYASLSHLRKFPVSWLKIDRSFVSGLDTEPEAAAIVHAVVGLAQSLGIGIVAEGVETEAQLRFLRQRRCDVGQGYLFGKPMSATRVAGFLRDWTDGRFPAPIDPLRRAG